MMGTIEKYIHELLHQHDCVIIPGLGGLVGNYQACGIIRESSMFYPPSKEIGFNRSLSHNDGLLANYIARREGISYLTALNMVNGFVTDIKREISSGRVIAFEKIGVFRGDAIGNLLFTPSRSCSFLPSSLGLEAFIFEPLENGQVLKSEQLTITSLSNKRRSLSYWAGVAAFMSGIFFFSTMELNMPGVSQASFQSIITPPTYLNAADITSKAVNASTCSDTMFFISTKKEHEPNLIPANDEKKIRPFNLIAASFNKPEQALEFIEGLNALGYSEANLLPTMEGKFRVAVKSFDNREEAISNLAKLRMEPGFSNAWLLVSR